MKKAALLIIFFFPVLICWGGEENQQTPTSPGKEVPVRSDRGAQDRYLYESPVVSYFSIPPHIFLDKDKKVTGAIYDLIEDSIAPEIGVKFQWETEPTSPARQFHNLKDKNNRVLCLAVYVPARRDFMIYSKEPYYYAQSIIAVHKSNPLKVVNEASDISNMVFGYSQKAYITPFMRDPSIQFDLISSPDFLEINLKKVMAHRIDGIYSPGKASSIFFLKKFGVIDDFRLIDLPEKPTPLYFGFSKGNKMLADEFDQAFERLGGQQLYVKLLSRYIDISKLEHVSEKP
ncbi:transporter substrate-binding domain-containing protein [uncultured Desulfosarcina sp.]|uniref:substrate-binding periplasmic protein n=1 Tax=uncultured Desulfosarcina sp. TaxID=218289 RepID=UPI0029C6342D|nr:transporter substrate-binding domain-containing protein [uncultured Desulfosarcina sp.]